MALTRGRADLERRQIGYVLAVARHHRVTSGLRGCRAGKLTASLPPRAWQCLSAGSGAKGHRYYDWAWVAIGPARTGYRWLLVRRNRRTRELALAVYRSGSTPLSAARFSTSSRNGRGKLASQTSRGGCAIPLPSALARVARVKESAAASRPVPRSASITMRAAPAGRLLRSIAISSSAAAGSPMRSNSTPAMKWGSRATGPASIGQAARIAGVTPADIQLLLVHLG